MWLRADLEKLVGSFALGEGQRHFLSSRWLENVLWMESAAQRTRKRYYGLRLVTVVGAVIVPSLVSINAVGGAEAAITWLTFVVSLVVALSAAVEGFFRFGDRWRHYRSLVEELKLEGWAFHELSGPYRVEGATQATAFPVFVDRVNALLARETQTYISQIAAPAQEKAADPAQTVAPDEPAAAPDEPAAAPDEPAAAPDEPVAVPDEPVAVPDEPAAPADTTEP